MCVQLMMLGENRRRRSAFHDSFVLGLASETWEGCVKPEVWTDAELTRQFHEAKSSYFISNEADKSTYGFAPSSSFSSSSSS